MHSGDEVVEREALKTERVGVSVTTDRVTMR